MPLGPDETDPPEPGTPVAIRTGKWDGGQHWTTTMWFLGRDEHGLWLGNPAGTRVHRPGAEFRGAAACAKYVPDDGWFVAHRNGPGSHLHWYVDVATPPVLAREPELGWTLRTIDLDLDVVLRTDGRLFVDDEDEFAEHQVRYGYPADVIARAEESAAWLMAALADRSEPFGSVADHWLDLATRTPLPPD